MAVEIVDDTIFSEKVSKGKTVVKYYADWCGSCKLFSPKFKRLSGDERFEGIQFLDVNAEHNPEARKMAGVSTLPYFAIFKDGQLIDSISTAKEEQLLQLMEKL